MKEKLNKLKARYEELGRLLSAPDAMNDRDAWREMVKEHSSLEEIVSAYHAYEETQTSLKDCRDMLSDHLDPEMKELVREEIAELEQKSSEQEEALKARFSLDDAQLAWRRWCIAANCGGDLKRFRQAAV